MSADIRTCDDFNRTPGTAGAGPEQKLLTFSADSSPSSATASSPGLGPISPHTQYTLSPTPVTTQDSASKDDASPFDSLAVLCCDHCPFILPDCDVASFVMHIMKEHHPPGSTQLWCGRETCKGQTSRDYRSLERHIRSYHLDKRYVCRCRYRNARKDKYRNHLDKCKVQVPPGSLYRCLCGQQFDGDTREGSNGEYRSHFEQCGTLRKGRKRKHGT